MMKKKNLMIKQGGSLLGLMTLLVTLTGCIGGSSMKERFYMLEPLSDAQHNAPETGRLRIIGLRPVKVPGYLDRPQIVKAIGKNAYQLSEFHRWAESLDHNITRVLIQNLSQLVPARVLLTSTSSQARKAPVSLAVNLFEFHVDPQGMARLSAQLSVTKNKTPLMHRTITHQVRASGTDYQLMVVALNKCINQLSMDIAQSLQDAEGQAAHSDRQPDALIFP